VHVIAFDIVIHAMTVFLTLYVIANYSVHVIAFDIVIHAMTVFLTLYLIIVCM
jgi:hypothetical protein